jgi:predicted metal-binding membrane protein
VLGSLAGVTLVAWTYLFVAAAGMSSAGDGGIASPGMDGMGALGEWAASDFGRMLLMWVVMMMGMMVPTAAPTALIYASVARKAANQRSAMVPTAAFVAGYVVIWCAFSVLATLLQWQPSRVALLSPMMVLYSANLGAGLLIIAGFYQMTPLKQACLRHCRSPVDFIANHWRSGTGGAARVGSEHGIFCLGCCWILMLLLFVGGVMNLLWIAVITAFVLIEKLTVRGEAAGRVAGVAMIAAGTLLLFWRG